MPSSQTPQNHASAHSLPSMNQATNQTTNQATNQTTATATATATALRALTSIRDSSFAVISAATDPLRSRQSQPQHRRTQSGRLLPLPLQTDHDGFSTDDEHPWLDQGIGSSDSLLHSTDHHSIPTDQYMQLTSLEKDTQPSPSPCALGSVAIVQDDGMKPIHQHQTQYTIRESPQTTAASNCFSFQLPLASGSNVLSPSFAAAGSPSIGGSISGSISGSMGGSMSCIPTDLSIAAATDSLAKTSNSSQDLVAMGVSAVRNASANASASATAAIRMAASALSMGLGTQPHHDAVILASDEHAANEIELHQLDTALVSDSDAEDGLSVLPSASSAAVLAHPPLTHVIVDDEFIPSKWEFAEDYHLHSIDHTPPFWRRPFILSGYRLYYPFHMCFCSLFKLHNETGNCWTHLLGFLFFTLANIAVLVERDVHDREYLVVYLLGVQLCMMFSVLYHLLNCHSHHAFVRFLNLDLCGISVQILASYVPAIHFAFYCEVHYQIIYLSAIALFALLGIVAPYLEMMHRPENEKWRQLIYISMTSSGAIPCLHWAYATSTEEFEIFVGYLTGMFGFYGLGVIVYLANFPERLLPGKFDIWFHSHQWWHVFVMAAAFTLLVGCFKYAEFHETNECS